MEKCLVRKEGEFWIGSCMARGEKMKIVRSKDFDEIRDYARKNDLKLEIVDRLKTNKESPVFSK